MANTGYIINPKVIQVFTTGPNSGSIVSSSFTVEFSGSFTSSFLCNKTYENKIFDPINCAVSNFCINPIINNITPTMECDNINFNYTYTINYNTNTPSSSQSIIEYSLQSDFSGEVGTSGLITNYSQSMDYDLIYGLPTYPLNQHTPIYFRIKNICSGSISSSYSPISQYNCPLPPESTLHPIFLKKGCRLRTPSILYYIDGEIGDLSDSTYICNTNNQFDLAPSGSYSDGFIERYFNGIVFTTTNECY